MKLVHFLGVEIETGPGALIPRAETALLGRTALAKLHAAGAASGASSERRVRFVDVCCGTGNLACALAAALPSAHGFALDLTDGCVALARANVGRLGLAARVVVLQGDLFAPLEARDLDVIVCNPPYISTGKLATRDDLRDEPREAFDGGPYGIAIHQRVAREAVALLRPGGWLTFEIGHGQERQLELVIGRTKAYDQIELVADEAGATRVIAARKRPS